MASQSISIPGAEPGLTLVPNSPAGIFSLDQAREKLAESKRPELKVLIRDMSPEYAMYPNEWTHEDPALEEEEKKANWRRAID